ncbi:hypothetical protein FCI23_42620 [Actinacidiphila oryziradicis]|uniref:Killer suppression protein HigA n=1 Tax=Actinacidiphila oryziradicis TaxID=2571141 RepID=A0A4V5MZ07_9ACTN|nr:hypothetical protein FCI23_42620 [Actinacidiphila oryziradicis]
MKILFGDGEVARICNDDDVRRSRYGPALASTIRRRLGEISAVTHLAELRRLPATRLRRHPDRGDGYLLISLGATADLLVRPRDDPAPALPDGRLDEHAVRALVVTAIVP